MKKKILALCLVVVLVATAITGVTLAYFTDVTETKTNTFTAGNVDIELDEPKWDSTKEHNIMPGASLDKDPTITVKQGSEDCYVFLDVTLNKYKSLFPIIALNAVANGDMTQAEFDACIVNEKFSTKTFLDSYYNGGDMAKLRTILNKWFVGIKHENWEIKGFYYDVARDDVEGTGNWLTLRLAYIGAGDAVLSADESVVFMTAFTMPSSVTEAMIDNDLTTNKFYEGNDFEIDFTAYAIQAQEFDNVSDAFNAYFEQN